MKATPTPESAASSFFDRAWWNQSRVIIAAAVGLVVFGLGGTAIFVGMSMTGMGGEGGEGGSDDAGPPFSRETFDVLYKTASFQGWSMRGDYDTGRCEVLKQIVEHMPVQDDYEGASRLTEEQAYAMTAPNGSLTVTINSWTAGDPVPASPGVREEALDAVGACPDYIVGTRISEDD